MGKCYLNKFQVGLIGQGKWDRKVSGFCPWHDVYVLRLWRELTEAEAWRFVLEEPQTGQRRGFADFGALMEFLKRELQRPPHLEN